MKYQRVSLINPPLDLGKIECVDAGHWQPLNLLTLSSYLVSQGYAGDIQILDKDVHSPEMMARELENFEPDFVGLSPNIDAHQISIMTPLPGSPAFEMLLGINSAMKEKNARSDWFDLAELQKDWFTHLCSVDYESVLQTARGMDDDEEKLFIEFS
jgi:hypothetical protein